MSMKFDANETVAEVHIQLNKISESIGHGFIDQVRAIAEREDVWELSKTIELAPHILSLRIMSHALGHVIAACPDLEDVEIDKCVGLMKLTVETFRS